MQEAQGSFEVVVVVTTTTPEEQVQYYGHRSGTTSDLLGRKIACSWNSCGSTHKDTETPITVGKKCAEFVLWNLARRRL